MVKKQHKFILKAFLNAKIPLAVRQHAPQLIALDSAIGGYCEQLLKAKSKVLILPKEMITKDEIRVFTQLIDNCAGAQKEELVIYYRLIRLTESVLYCCA